MGIFDLMREHRHEQLIFCSDTEAGLRAHIGIHDTTLGPALGARSGHRPQHGFSRLPTTCVANFGVTTP